MVVGVVMIPPALIVVVLVALVLYLRYVFSNDRKTKLCPQCRESVKKDALVCKHCGADLKAGAIA